MGKDERDQLEDLARKYGVSIATQVGLAFIIWLSQRPRIAKHPRLARLLYMIAGGKA